MNDSKNQIQLKQSKLSFKLTVKKDLEYKIRTLCSNISTIEWSGILFYRHKGDLDEGTFEVECVDLYLMDIGSSGYTEFETSPEIAAYLAENLDLFDCQMGLIHSHNNMATFFSSTDNNTLLQQGQENNHFLSLIVNNEGKYTAAITRQIFSEYTINENCEYKSFGDKIVKKKNKSKGKRKFVEKINAEITVEEMYSFADRIKQIKDSKVKVITTPATSNYNPYGSYYQRSLFEDFDYTNFKEKNKKKEEENKSDVKKGTWVNNYYHNIKSAPKSSVKLKADTLADYENSFEYDIVMEILDVNLIGDVYKEIEEIEKQYDEVGITNQEFKNNALEYLNFYDANYNVNYKLMNDIVDLLPQNRITSTLKSIIADERN